VSTIGRRRVLAGGLTLTALGVSGAIAASGVGATATVKYKHPGLLHSAADLARMRAKVKAGAAPWLAGWQRLVNNPHSSADWEPSPLKVVIRGSGNPPNNYPTLFKDIHAAYQNALRYQVSGDKAHGNAARDILNAWSSTLTQVTGDDDKFLAAGIYGYLFCNAAELMRGYSGFDLARFQQMMANVFYPLSHALLKSHNGTFITNYWANWDLCSTACVLAIGILCDEADKVTEAVSYFKGGAGWGSVKHAVQFIEPGGLGQWQEAGRDQDHTMFGIGLAGAICQMAWSQGIDLFGFDGNRLLAGCEYVAKYNLGNGVPFTKFTMHFGAPSGTSRFQPVTAVSAASRGEMRPVWELVYNHYVKLRGLHAPFTSLYASHARAEGGGGNYGEINAGYDQFGFGTLCYTL
jgi:hypothetical protein